MKLILVRHGETEENIKRIVQGHTHGTLSELGLDQSKKLALRLKHEKIDVVYCSDLRRARQTAEEIMKYHKVPIHYTEEVRERFLGPLHGKTIEEAWGNSSHSGRDHPDREGIESLADFRARAKGFLDKISEKHKGQAVLVVSHGGFNRNLLAAVLKKPVSTDIVIKQANCCVNVIQMRDDGTHQVILMNCIKHLE